MVNATSSPGDGITGGYTGHSLGIRVTIATLAGITWYNAIELIILVFVTFSKYRGLYFWSLLVTSSIGLVPYSLGFLLKFFQLSQVTWLSVTLITIGWWCMVTGQSIVLYSRLHLVLRNPPVLRRVLAMIIVDAIILHIPTTVLTYGSNVVDSSNSAYTHGYNIMEKIQMTGFCLQEFIISGLYIYETTKMLRLDPDRGKRKIMYQLVIINFLMVIMDVGLLVIEYRNYYIMETMIKGVIYSIKLKLEFAVLGKLVHLVSAHVWKSDSVVGGAPPADPSIFPGGSSSHSHGRKNSHHHHSHHSHHNNSHYLSDYPDFVDATRVTSDLTHATSNTNTHRRSHPWMDTDDVSIAMFEHSSPSAHHNHHQHQPEASIPEAGVVQSSHSNHSEVSHSYSGETVRNNQPFFADRELSPVDFTNFTKSDSFRKERTVDSA